MGREWPEIVVGEFPAELPEQLKFQAGRGFYKAAEDLIWMPKFRVSTLVHELIHATGHPKRLGRFCQDRLLHFGSVRVQGRAYWAEERLVKIALEMLGIDDGYPQYRFTDLTEAWCQNKAVEALKYVKQWGIG